MAINTRSAHYTRFQSSFKIVKARTGRNKDNKRTEKVKTDLFYIYNFFLRGAGLVSSLTEYI